MKLLWHILFLFGLAAAAAAQKQLNTDVLVVGGGTGGTAAGIQCARMGVPTIIVEATPWLGGMISAAGVSAVDGNHKLPSGLWAEFRDKIYAVYGGPQAVATGWVSNTQFEPHVADSIFKTLAAAEKSLRVLHGYQLVAIGKRGAQITNAVFIHKRSKEKLIVTARRFVDATELGDVFAMAGVPYSLGMEAGATTGENVGVTASNNIVQDLTWVAVLKDYGMGSDKTIPKPANYNAAEFDGSNTDYYIDTNRKKPTVDAKKMLDYGRLPNNKYMLNWPGYGNDTYVNVVELKPADRDAALEVAKATTLRFVYFIQQQLGFKNLGLADDEFPTPDRLALMPYHREGRRVQGLVRFTMRHIAEPFTYAEPLYRTGISVGDYPIDHHHKKNSAAPQHLDFYPIPSFNVPLGALIPKGISNLIVAEKGISVSNIANGTTRLQPCVMLTGQAAGVLAAISIKQNKAPANVAVRKVQESLLRSKAYLMPYIDVTPDNQHWEAVQKIGATGILKGTGIPYKWANQTWFYPDSLADAAALAKGLNEYHKDDYVFKNNTVSAKDLVTVLLQFKKEFEKTTKLVANAKAAENILKSKWPTLGLKNFDLDRPLTRLEVAVVLNQTINPFQAKSVSHSGKYLSDERKHGTY